MTIQWGTRKWGIRSVALLVLGVLLSSLSVASCHRAPKRSAAAFCKTLVQEKKKFLSDFDNSKQQPLQSFITGLASVGEIPVIFDKLDKVAPADIEPDVAAVRDNFKKQIDSIGGSASNPLNAFAAALVSGLVAAGPFQEVQRYVVANCPAGA